MPNESAAYSETRKQHGEKMKISKLMLAMLATGVLGCSVLSQQAQAVQIDGTIGFTSAPHLTGGSVSQAGGTTSLHFNNPMFVNFGTDNYAGTTGKEVTFTDFSFTGSGTGAALSSGSIVPEWTFTSGAITYSFDLLNLTAGTFSSGNPNALSLQGMGIAHITGFDDTNASFSLQGTGKGFTFTILQASTTATPSVPEGGSAVALLGIAMAAVEALRRKIRVA
ncbi:MAG: hypothetical protein H0W86_09305 [Armatimonadetes bacterium]|nr:hypothetical protein [Armatimonadota bacterium]